MSETTTPKKKRGGDTRAAAAANGKAVGPPLKRPAQGKLTEVVSFKLAQADKQSLDAWAKMTGKKPGEYARDVLEEHLRAKLFV